MLLIYLVWLWQLYTLLAQVLPAIMQTEIFGINTVVELLAADVDTSADATGMNVLHLLGLQIRSQAAS